MKIKLKYALTIFVTGLCTVGISAVVYYCQFIQIAKARHLDIIRQDAVEIAAAIDKLLIEKTKIAVTLGRAPILRRAVKGSSLEFGNLDPKARQRTIQALNDRWMQTRSPDDPFIQRYLSNPAADYLKEQQAALPKEYGEIFLTDRYGVLTAATAKLTTLAHAHKYWWKAACNNGEGCVFFDDRGYDDSAGDYVLGIVVPLREENEIIGVLKCNLLILGAVSEIVLDMQEKDPAEILLTRSGGRVIYEKGKTPLSAQLPPALQAALENRAADAVLMDDQAPKKFVGLSQVAVTAGLAGYGFGGSAASIDHKRGNKGETWYVVKTRPVASVQTLIGKTAGLLLLVGIGMSGVLAIVALFIGSRLSRPIRKMAEATRKIGEGTFDIKIDIHTRDELGELARSFNRMAGELQRTTASKADLEREIAERIETGRALKKHQALLEATGRMARVGGWELDAETSVVSWTEETYRIHEVPLDYKPPLAEALDFYPADDRKRLERAIQRALDDGEPYDLELGFITATGAHRWVRTICRPKTAGGKIVTLSGTFQDITDRKQAETTLQKALTEKEALLREIHHRVKNNMQTIVGLLRMHARRTDDAQLTQIFNNCRDRIEAMSLIHEALYQSDDLSRIDFESYLKKLCRNLGQAHDAGGKGITLTASAADVSLSMDQGIAVGIIITELISNAFKHAFHREKNGRVTVNVNSTDAGMVELIVADDGAGLPPDFDIQKTSSLGLKLVAASVTRELGGTIDVERNHGARFVIRFKCESE